MVGRIDDVVAKEPKDLGVKIGTPEQVFWKDVKKKCEEMIEQIKHETIIQEHILKLCEKKILVEEQKIKA